MQSSSKFIILNSTISDLSYRYLSFFPSRWNFVCFNLKVAEADIYKFMQASIYMYLMYDKFIIQLDKEYISYFMIIAIERSWKYQVDSK